MQLSVPIFLLWILSVVLAYCLLIYVLVIPKIPNRLITEGAIKILFRLAVDVITQFLANVVVSLANLHDHGSCIIR